MPRDWSTFPSLYTEEELDWLEGSRLQQNTRDKHLQFATSYNIIADAIPEFSSKYSIQEFIETYCLVLSRGFLLKI